ncbi:MAG: type I-C CRISPR-associated protein Cas8c/Csd1 [Desulfobacteria bacterium]
MLELLINYARTHLPSAPEPGFAAKDVRWVINCDAQGNFLDVIELGDTTRKKNKGQLFVKCPAMSLGEKKSEGVTKSHFLVDSAEVVILFSKTPDDEKILAKHRYFAFLLREAASAMPELGMLAEKVLKPEVLDAIRQRLVAQKGRPTDKVTFRIGDIFPVDSTRWHEWWRSFRCTLAAAQHSSGSSDVMRCFASGMLVEPARIHSDKITGLADVGGLRAGDVLVGFKQDSFCSFGLEKAFNVAVSDDMAATYCAALNELIRKSGQRVAGTKVVHWFKGKDIPKDDDPLYWLQEGSGEKELNAQHRAQELLNAIRKGAYPDIGENYYYALTLSGASGRIMVRDWMEGKFEELVKKIFDWFEDLSIVHRDGKGLAPSPKFMAVLGATVRELDELTNPFVAKMWRVAVRGEIIPEAALAKTFGRVKVDILKDEPVSHAGIGLIKAYHVRNNRMKGGNKMAEDIKPYLNENHPHPAYQCGRLMAVLAKLQRSALGDVGAGIVQRYYAAASSTPALVLGRLVRTSQAHLNKLEPGLANWYENIIASIWGHIKDMVPATLTLEEQTLFALGYYQQIAHKGTNTPKNDNQTKEVENV